MKECYWCKEQKPDNEEGSFELEPDTEEEIGWICDHCVLCFDGKCGCEECQKDDEIAQKKLKEYNSKLPLRDDTRSMIGIGMVICFCLPILLALLISFINWIK